MIDYTSISGFTSIRTVRATDSFSGLWKCTAVLCFVALDLFFSDPLWALFVKGSVIAAAVWTAKLVSTLFLLMSSNTALSTNLAVTASDFAVAEFLAVEAPQRVRDVCLDIQLQVASFHFSWWYARVKS